MKARLALLLVAFVPLVGPIACRQYGVAMIAAAVLVVPLMFGLAPVAYVGAWACAQLVSVLLSNRDAQRH